MQGILRLRVLPDQDWTEEQFRFWWCDERSPSGRVLRPARMSQREKERYTCYESHNLITTAGITQVLTFIGAYGGGIVAFAQYLAIGNGGIFTVNANDTTLAGEFFRKIPTGYSTSGNAVDISTALLTTDAVGSWTNVGLFGNGATSTPNSGTLMTHLLTSFTKGSTAYTADYQIAAQ